MEFWKGIPHCTVQKRRNALDVDLRRNIFLFAIFFNFFFLNISSRSTEFKLLLKLFKRYFKKSQV